MDKSTKSWSYKGWLIKWDKDEEQWNLFTPVDRELDWSAGNKQEARDFINDY